MEARPMTVAGYARVSTENQLENYSIEEQAGRLRAFCAAKGWALGELYVDGGYSGGNTDRPALQRMLSHIRRGGVDAVVVCKLDRLSRSQKDTMTLIEDELLAHGVDFVSISENFDTSTPFGRAMIGILSVFAQLEKDQITERFTMGRIGRSRAGYYHGGSRPPTGYDYRDGLLQVNEYEAIQVREAFALFLAGKSVNAVSRELSARYAAGWTPAKVLGVLKNTVYTGKVHFRKQDYDGLHQPLVSAQDFQAAARLLGPGSRREAAKTAPQRSPFRAGYFLSGLVWCARCGARYSAGHGCYRCYSRSKCSPKFVRDPSCKNRSWPIEELDAVVLRQLEALLRPALLWDVLRPADVPPAPGSGPAALQKRLGEIDAQTGRLIELYQVGPLPREEVERRAAALRTERDRLRAQLNAPPPPPPPEGADGAARRFWAGFAAGDMDSRRALAASLVERVEVDGEAVAIRWRL